MADIQVLRIPSPPVSYDPAGKRVAIQNIHPYQSVEYIFTDDGSKLVLKSGGFITIDKPVKFFSASMTTDVILSDNL